MLPPLPLAVEPEPIYTVPLSPELAVPVLNTNTPLTPDGPAFDVDTSTEPLDDATP